MYVYVCVYVEIRRKVSEARNSIAQELSVCHIDDRVRGNLSRSRDDKKASEFDDRDDDFSTVRFAKRRRKNIYIRTSADDYDARAERPAATSTSLIPFRAADGFIPGGRYIHEDDISSSAR